MVFSSSIRYTVMGIINDLINSYGIISREAIDSYLYKDNHRFTEYRNDETYHIVNGASKICIIFDSLMDWVIKIPIMYNTSPREETNYKQQFSKDIKSGNFGSYLSVSPDLCEKEVKIYNDAVNAGVDKVFAEEKKIMTYHGIPIYAQARINCTFMDSERSEDDPDFAIDDEIDELLNNIYTTAAIDNLYEDLTPFIEDLYSYTGKNFLNIISFISENQINDLHNENVGYDFNDNPIFFDYSGF